MELFQSEVAEIKKLLGEWIEHSGTYELEATFGGPQGLDMTDFMSVIKRIKARYGDGVKQLNRLTVTLQDYSRFTIVDNNDIEQYCKDNRIEGKKIVAITKSPTGRGKDLELPDYDVKIKTRAEVEMTRAQIEMATKDWERKLKAFRLISRWTFTDPGHNVRIDASVVYSTKRIRKGTRFDYAWSEKYRDLKQEVPSYEIEVELLNSDPNKDIAHAQKVLITNIGEVLRGIQKNPILIRKQTKENVLGDYKALALPKDSKFSDFRGNPPKTLLFNNIVPPTSQEGKGKRDEPSLYDGYNVTDKADGLRVLSFTNKEGELFLIDMSLQVYRTGLKNPTCRESLLDGEWVTTSKHGEPIQQLCLFDLFIVNQKDYSQLAFVDEDDDPDVDTRLARLTKWVEDWNKEDNLKGTLRADGVKHKGAISVSHKEFLVGRKNTTEIFSRAAEMLRKTNDPKYPYHTDGLIFTPNRLPLPDLPGVVFAEQFKWKPSTESTIDFLIKAELDENKKEVISYITAADRRVIRCKKYTLYVKGVVDELLQDPRNTVLQKKGIPISLLDKKAKLPYRLVPFQPNEFEDPMASTCYVEIKGDEDTTRTENGEPLVSDTIVEMEYDSHELNPEFRWKPKRIRHDKTARYSAAMKKTGGRTMGSRTINAFFSAMDVWKSIHNPVTEDMITTGNTVRDIKQIEASIKQSDPSINRYYQNAITTNNRELIDMMTNFHNRYIKEQILLNPTVKNAGSKVLIDLSVGQGSDIGRWQRAGVSFAFGVDKALFGIVDKENGAYRRYLTLIAKNKVYNDRLRSQYERSDKRQPLVLSPAAPMLFAAGDSSKFIPDGTSAGENKLDAMIMRSLFGKGTPTDAPPFLKDQQGKLANGAGVTTMMFALHYMFQTKEMLEGFIENLRACVQVSGYFVGCCFDGERVFNLLKTNTIGKDETLQRTLTREDGIPVKIWSIKRQYEKGDVFQQEDDEDSYGQAIEVDFISIGKPYTEYLVPFSLLKQKLKEANFRLLNKQELAKLGLEHSTNTFDQSWEMAKKLKDEQGKPMYADEGMDAELKEFSFLNRWFIFTRTDGAIDEVKEGGELPSLQGVSVGGMTQEGGAIPSDPSLKKEYEINDVFQFHLEAPLIDRFKLGDKSAARWLAPISRFPIEDPDGRSYPSLDHYMAAMRYKYGASRKDGSPVDDDFLQALFGQDGSIHQRALRAEVRERGENNIEDDQLKIILKQEYDEIQKQVKPAGFKSHGLVADDASWSEHREALLREGLQQRWEKDERFRKAVIALGKQNKYLLYYNPSAGMSYYGGMRKANKIIEGENMVGRIIMDLAKFGQSK